MFGRKKDTSGSRSPSRSVFQHLPCSIPYRWIPYRTGARRRSPILQMDCRGYHSLCGRETDSTCHTQTQGRQHNIRNRFKNNTFTFPRHKFRLPADRLGTGHVAGWSTFLVVCGIYGFLHSGKHLFRCTDGPTESKKKSSLGHVFGRSAAGGCCSAFFIKTVRLTWTTDI